MPEAPKPTIAATSPARIELEPGAYWWCRCGKSQSQPFCDSSHREEGIFTPLEFEITEKRRVSLCRCKQTGTPPFCDGTHRTLDE